jgi:ABC-type transport system involved in Fe-S cluster assembly fused permease/ATPase subunit
MRAAAQRAEKAALDSYSKAGFIANEVIANIRTVTAYTGEEAETARYDSALEPSERAGRKKGVLMGLTQGTFMFVMFSSYACGMRFGAYLIQWNRRDHPECIGDPNGAACFTGAHVMRCGGWFRSLLLARVDAEILTV